MTKHGPPLTQRDACGKVYFSFGGEIRHISHHLITDTKKEGEREASKNAEREREGNIKCYS